MITRMVNFLSLMTLSFIVAEELEQAGQKLEAKVYQTLQLQVGQQIYVIMY